MTRPIRSVNGQLPVLEATVGREKTLEEARADLALLVDAWASLIGREQAGKTASKITVRDARMWLAKILIAQRHVTQWLMGDAPSLPEFVVEDGHVVVGSVRVPLTVDLLEAFMKGQMP